MTLISVYPHKSEKNRGIPPLVHFPNENADNSGGYSTSLPRESMLLLPSRKPMLQSVSRLLRCTSCCRKHLTDSLPHHPSISTVQDENIQTLNEALNCETNVSLLTHVAHHRVVSFPGTLIVREIYRLRHLENMRTNDRAGIKLNMMRRRCNTSGWRLHRIGQASVS